MDIPSRVLARINKHGINLKDGNIVCSRPGVYGSLAHSSQAFSPLEAKPGVFLAGGPLISDLNCVVVEKPVCQSSLSQGIKLLLEFAALGRHRRIAPQEES